MNTRAANFARDWALQHVGPGGALAATDPEAERLIVRLIEASRLAGIGESALYALDLPALIIEVRALRNGGKSLRWQLKARRLQKVRQARAAALVTS